ncbi:hypothetical protein ABGV17_04330 [Guyparkeria sp. GHLCS8-2]|uniref:hypothetical protein n=1 Tax=Guyparkeria halopsychrophila TaxID=3139421 RepID=UPI0037C54573
MRGDRVRLVRDALAEYPGGAHMPVIAEDLGEQLERIDISLTLSYLYRRGEVVRRGKPRSFVWALATPDLSIPETGKPTH